MLVRRRHCMATCLTAAFGSSCRCNGCRVTSSSGTISCTPPGPTSSRLPSCDCPVSLVHMQLHAGNKSPVLIYARICWQSVPGIIETACFLMLQTAYSPPYCGRSSHTTLWGWPPRLHASSHSSSSYLWCTPWWVIVDRLVFCYVAAHRTLHTRHVHRAATGHLTCVCHRCAGHCHVPLHCSGLPKRDGGIDRRRLLLPGPAAAGGLPACARRWTLVRWAHVSMLSALVTTSCAGRLLRHGICINRCCVAAMQTSRRGGSGSVSFSPFPDAGTSAQYRVKAKPQLSSAMRLPHVTAPVVLRLCIISCAYCAVQIGPTRYHTFSKPLPSTNSRHPDGRMCLHLAMPMLARPS